MYTYVHVSGVCIDNQNNVLKFITTKHVDINFINNKLNCLGIYSWILVQWNFWFCKINLKNIFIMKIFLTWNFFYFLIPDKNLNYLKMAVILSSRVIFFVFACLCLIMAVACRPQSSLENQVSRTFYYSINYITHAYYCASLSMKFYDTFVYCH